MNFRLDEKFVYFNVEYSRLYRFVYSAYLTKKINPNASLAQSRLVLEFLVESMVGKKGDLLSRIIELNEFWGVSRDIVDAMHEVRLLGNIGVHANLVFWKEALRALKALIKIMQWYGSSSHQLIKNKDFLADVQFCLAICYEVGIGTDPDVDKQVEWLEKACENGNFFALRDLGIIYFDGKIKAQDYKKAADLLKKAAKKGSSDAEYFLGVMYFGSYPGIVRDTKLAHDLFLSASNKGNLLAEYALSDFFNSFTSGSSEISYDPKENFARYKRIIEQGEEDETYWHWIPRVWIKLGDCFQYGLGTDKDAKKSFACYLKAAKRENADAWYKLAQCYEKGIGTKKDMLQAKEYYFLAAFQGHQGAKNKLSQFDYEKYKKLL